MIVLMGIKHCGKTTVGKRLSERLGISFYDIDDEIERMTGTSVRTLYREKGVDAFKEAEAAACRQIIARDAETADECVIAAGGGICDNGDALSVLKAAGCVAVYLQIDEKTACDRIIAEYPATGSWPAYIQKEHPAGEQDVRRIFNGFYRRRSEAYQAFCSVTVNVSGTTPDEVCDRIMGAVQQ